MYDFDNQLKDNFYKFLKLQFTQWREKILKENLQK